MCNTKVYAKESKRLYDEINTLIQRKTYNLISFWNANPLVEVDAETGTATPLE